MARTRSIRGRRRCNYSSMLSNSLPETESSSSCTPREVVAVNGGFGAQVSSGGQSGGRCDQAADDAGHGELGEAAVAVAESLRVRRPHGCEAVRV